MPNVCSVFHERLFRKFSHQVESQSHHSMHDVYLQFPVYFTTIPYTLISVTPIGNTSWVCDPR